MVEISQKYDVNEHVDCLDECGKWCDAKVQQMMDGKAYITYSGYSSKFDEWIELQSPRIQKQWRVGQRFMLNNRLDVRD